MFARQGKDKRGPLDNAKVGKHHISIAKANKESRFVKNLGGLGRIRERILNEHHSQGTAPSVCEVAVELERSGLPMNKAWSTAETLIKQLIESKQLRPRRFSDAEVRSAGEAIGGDLVHLGSPGIIEFGIISLDSFDNVAQRTIRDVSGDGMLPYLDAEPKVIVARQRSAFLESTRKALQEEGLRVVDNRHELIQVLAGEGKLHDSFLEKFEDLIKERTNSLNRVKILQDLGHKVYNINGAGRVTPGIRTDGVVGYIALKERQ